VGKNFAVLDIFLWDIYRDPLHNMFSNIKVDIWNPAVGVRCIIPPRHLSQLKIRAIGYQISILIFEKKLWRGSL
jgi:hypothetical protein